jgi:hypothetical protein
MSLIMAVIGRWLLWPSRYESLTRYCEDEIEILDDLSPADIAAQNLSSTDEQKLGISTNDRAGSGGMSTTSNRSSCRTDSSSMSIDTKAFRRDARRLDGWKKAKRNICHDVEISSPLRLSNRSWDFEHVTGLPARPPDADVIMEEVAEQWCASARPSTSALPGHERSSFADWHSYDIEVELEVRGYRC